MVGKLRSLAVTSVTRWGVWLVPTAPDTVRFSDAELDRIEKLVLKTSGGHTSGNGRDDGADRHPSGARKMADRR